MQKFLGLQTSLLWKKVKSKWKINVVPNTTQWCEVVLSRIRKFTKEWIKESHLKGKECTACPKVTLILRNIEFRSVQRQDLTQSNSNQGCHWITSNKWSLVHGANWLDFSPVTWSNFSKFLEHGRLYVYYVSSV